MPDCGSQITICDLPVRFDTYRGCGHGCQYCFVLRKYGINHINPGESVKSLRGFIEGRRSRETNWCDWDIPLHWGGTSDPFQPIERVKGRSLECLKVFADTQYPFVVSTKSALIAEEPYLSLIKRCNCVVQFSACSPRYDRMERGASPYEERIRAASLVAPHRRVNLRIQPYIPAIFSETLRAIKRYAELGIHGATVEAMKYTKPNIGGLVKVGGDFCYPLSVLEPQYRAIKEVCHKHGLRFYCGENRLRAMSDELCCCGIEGLGWRENRANLNHYLFGDDFRFTQKMKETGTATVWESVNQDTVSGHRLKQTSYMEEMMRETKNPYAYSEGTPQGDAERRTLIRNYLKGEQIKAGLKGTDIDRALGNNMWGHFTAQAEGQWEFPTPDNYEKLRGLIPTLIPYGELMRMAKIKKPRIIGAKKR